MINSAKRIIPDRLKGWAKERALTLSVNYLHNLNISFSQAGEDLILRNIFPEKRNGFYVDVGAFHPFNISNTYYFYRFRGWKGVNIDARPGSAALFNKYRPRDVNLELAVSSKKEPLTYYFIDETSSMNSFSKEFLEKEGAASKITKEIIIQAKPLSEILSGLVPKNGRIDFLTADVEGMEVDALSSNDWDRFRPKAVVLEVSAGNNAEVLNSEICSFMTGLEYDPGAVTILSPTLRNVIFLDKNFNFGKD